jgi:hypothetical protein
MAIRSIAVLACTLFITGLTGCGEDPIEAIGPVGDESDDEIGSEADPSDDASESGSGEESGSTSSTSSDTTDTTTDTTTETTDTGDDSCQSPISIELLAQDYAAIDGWELTNSDFEPNQVLYMPEWLDQGTARFDIDIPCADTWHVWVRGLEQYDSDSYFIRVDGIPGPEQAIFELDCTDWPQNITYEWKQLNYRAANAGNCVYMFDPWLQTWDAGVHGIEFGYRESWAISRLWITNTQQSPP